MKSTAWREGLNTVIFRVRARWMVDPDALAARVLAFAVGEGVRHPVEIERKLADARSRTLRGLLRVSMTGLSREDGAHVVLGCMRHGFLGAALHLSITSGTALQVLGTLGIDALRLRLRMFWPEASRVGVPDPVLPLPPDYPTWEESLEWGGDRGCPRLGRGIGIDAPCEDIEILSRILLAGVAFGLERVSSSPDNDGRGRGKEACGAEIERESLFDRPGGLRRLQRIVPMTDVAERAFGLSWLEAYLTALGVLPA